MNIKQAAQDLLKAATERTPRGHLSTEWPELDLQTAYDVQDELLKLRIARGEQVIGVKLGLTSEAKQKQMGVDEPVIAWLTDAMLWPGGGVPVPVDRFIHPRVEPEIVFRLDSRLEGSGVTAHQALSCVDRVYAGIEVIDTRYAEYTFTVADAVADNASAAVFLLGDRSQKPESMDMTLEACLLEEDGVATHSATGAAVLGSPVQALVLAAHLLAERNLALEPGWLVLTGGMTDAVPLAPSSSVSARFTTLGAVVARTE